MVSFYKEVNPRLAKRPLETNGRSANLELTSLVKEATGSENPRKFAHADLLFRRQTMVCDNKMHMFI